MRFRIKRKNILFLTDTTTEWEQSLSKKKSILAIKPPDQLGNARNLQKSGDTKQSKANAEQSEKAPISEWDFLSGYVIYFLNFFFWLESTFAKCEWHSVTWHVLNFFFILLKAFKVKGCSLLLSGHDCLDGHCIIALCGGVSSVMKIIWYENILYVYFYCFLKRSLQ